MQIPMGLLQKNLPKIAAGSASLLAALYFAFSPRLAPALYARRMFRPHAYPEGDWNVAEIGGLLPQDSYFRGADGSRLHGWYFYNPSASQVILFSHGNTGNITGRQNLVRLLLQTGASVFIYDYRGYGKSEGLPSVRGIVEDGVAAFDHLVNGKGFRPSQIVIYGESLGTAVTAELAEERACAGVILQSGFSSLRKIGYERMPITRIYPTMLFPHPLLDSAGKMARVDKPLLVIHGKLDTVVPFAHAEEVFERARGIKTFVSLDAAHSDLWSAAPDTYVDGVRKFLLSLPVDVDPT